MINQRKNGNVFRAYITSATFNHILFSCKRKTFFSGNYISILPVKSNVSVFVTQTPMMFVFYLHTTIRETTLEAIPSSIRVDRKEATIIR